jgi:hypothetical protein
LILFWSAVVAAAAVALSSETRVEAVVVLAHTSKSPQAHLPLWLAQQSKSPWVLAEQQITQLLIVAHQVETQPLLTFSH